MEYELNPISVVAYLKSRCALTLPIKIVSQPVDSNFCWAACYRMVDGWHMEEKGQKIKEWCFHARCKKTNGICNSPTNPPCKQANLPRPTTSILDDWLKIGYESVHTDNSLDLREVTEAISKKNPIMVYLQYKKTNMGHYFLIIGATFKDFSAEAAWVIADPLKDNCIEMGISALGKTGHWQQSWEIIYP